MVVKLSNFKIIKEHPQAFEVQHPSGKNLMVDKANLSDKGKELIQKLCSGGMTGYADGTPAGGVPDPTEGLEPLQSPEGPGSAAVAGGSQGQNSGQGITPLPSGMTPEEYVAKNAPTPTPQLDIPFEEMKQANLAQAKSEAAQGAQESAALKDVNAKLEALPTQTDLINKYKASNDALFDSYASKQIDPDHFWNNHDTGSKVIAGLGLLLSGFGSGASGQPNMAAQVIEKAINNDIEAQRNDQSKALNLWKMNNEALGNEQAANLATQNQLLAGVKYKLMQAASGQMGPQAQARAQLANAQIQQQQDMNDLKLSFMQGGFKGGDPSAAVQFLVPPAQQKAVFDEIGKAQNARQSENEILNQFDTAAKENTVVNRALHLGFEPASVKRLDNLGLPLIRDQDGRVNEFEFNAFKDLQPAPGDTDAKTAAKRQGMLDFVRSKQAAPTAKGFGIDLSKYPTTSLNSVGQGQYKPGDVVSVKGKKYQVGNDGNTITPIQ